MKWLLVIVLLPVVGFGQLIGKVPNHSNRNLMPVVDFSTGMWTKTAAVTASGPGTFTTNAAGGCYPAIARLRVGTRYRLVINMTADVAYEIRNGSAGSSFGTSSGTYDFTAANTDGVYLRLSAAGTATVGKLTIHKR